MAAVEAGGISAGESRRVNSTSVPLELSILVADDSGCFEIFLKSQGRRRLFFPIPRGSHAMPTKKPQFSASEKATTLLGIAMSIALLLIAPKLSTDLIGKCTVAILSFAMALCFLGTVWSIRWFRAMTIRLVLGFVIVLAATSAITFWTWPPTLEITPSEAKFLDVFPKLVTNNETHQFRLQNRSDGDLYATEFDLIVDDKTAFSKEFSLNVPKESRKSFGEGGIAAENFADIFGFLCRDSSNSPLFVISIHRLTPHESREVNVTYTGSKKVEVLAKTGFYTTEPQSESINGSEVGTSFRFKTATDGTPCKAFTFIVDDKSHKGMYWFGHEDGKY